MEINRKNILMLFQQCYPVMDDSHLDTILHSYEVCIQDSFLELKHKTSGIGVHIFNLLDKTSIILNIEGIVKEFFFDEYIEFIKGKIDDIYKYLSKYFIFKIKSNTKNYRIIDDNSFYCELGDLEYVVNFDISELLVLSLDIKIKKDDNTIINLKEDIRLVCNYDKGNVNDFHVSITELNSIYYMLINDNELMNKSYAFMNKLYRFNSYFRSKGVEVNFDKEPITVKEYLKSKSSYSNVIVNLNRNKFNFNLLDEEFNQLFPIGVSIRFNKYHDIIYISVNTDIVKSDYIGIDINKDIPFDKITNVLYDIVSETNVMYDQLERLKEINKC